MLTLSGGLGRVLLCSTPMAAGPFVKSIQRVAGSENGSAAALLPPQRALYLDPDHFLVTDAPTEITQGTGDASGSVTGRIEVALNPAGVAAAALQLGTGTPAKVSNSAGAAGNATTAAPFNHTHQIDPASGSAAGSMSVAHFNALQGATADPTVDAIAKRGSGGEVRAIQHEVIDGVTAKLVVGPWDAGNDETVVSSDDGSPLGFMLPVRYRNASITIVPFDESSASAIVLDSSRGNKFDIEELVHNVTFGVPTGFERGSWFDIFIQQGAGAPFTISWNAIFVFPTGVTSTALGNDGNEVDYYRMENRGDYWVCTIHNMHVAPG